MKNYCLIPQERDLYCVPSVIQAILRRKGYNLTQDELAKELGFSGNGIRVTETNLKPFFNRFGYDFFHTRLFLGSNEISPENLKRNLIEMDKNEGIVGINKHVYLLEEFFDSTLFLVDPLDGQERCFDLLSFKEDVLLYNGFFGLLKTLP